jgi:transposase
MVDVENPRRRSRVVGAERTRLRARVEELYTVNNLSIRAIAEGIDRSYGSVHRLLNEAEVPMRSRGMRRRNQPTP